MRNRLTHHEPASATFLVWVTVSTMGLYLVRLESTGVSAAGAEKEKEDAIRAGGWWPEVTGN